MTYLDSGLYNDASFLPELLFYIMIGVLVMLASDGYTMQNL